MAGFNKDMRSGRWIYFTRNHNLHSNYIPYNVQFTTACTESSWSAVLHQSSGTGFQQRTFPLLNSRTVPVPQSQRPTVHFPSSGTASSPTDLYCLELLQVLVTRCLLLFDGYCSVSDERSVLSFASQNLQYLVVCQYIRT
jgi:hypothetical protein